MSSALLNFSSLEEVERPQKGEPSREFIVQYAASFSIMLIVGGPCNVAKDGERIQHFSQTPKE